MPASYDKLMSLAIPDTMQSYAPKDAILYAASLGIGRQPLDPSELSFVYEKGLRVLPTMGVVLAHPGFWQRDLDTGLDWVKIVHAEQALVVHKPLPTQAHVIGKSRIVETVDKGPAKGAFIAYERRIIDRDSGELLCTITQTMLCRGDGGLGGPQRTPSPPPAIPEREPDAVCDWATSPQIALLYRLNGDWNPLHADPAIAAKAGFARPIMHGLASFGISAYSIIKTLANLDVRAIETIFARFSSPVYPGETLRTEIWCNEATISYRVRCVERNALVINNGLMKLR
jgi:acyl dehydratase